MAQTAPASFQDAFRRSLDRVEAAEQHDAEQVARGAYAQDLRDMLPAFAGLDIDPLELTGALEAAVTSYVEALEEAILGIDEDDEETLSRRLRACMYGLGVQFTLAGELHAQARADVELEQLRSRTGELERSGHVPQAWTQERADREAMHRTHRGDREVHVRRLAEFALAGSYELHDGKVAVPAKPGSKWTALRVYVPREGSYASRLQVVEDQVREQFEAAGR